MKKIILLAFIVLLSHNCFSTDSPNSGIKGSSFGVSLASAYSQLLLLEQAREGFRPLGFFLMSLVSGVALSSRFLVVDSIVKKDFSKMRGIIGSYARSVFISSVLALVLEERPFEKSCLLSSCVTGGLSLAAMTAWKRFLPVEHIFRDARSAGVSLLAVGTFNNVLIPTEGGWKRLGLLLGLTTLFMSQHDLEVAGRFVGICVPRKKKLRKCAYLPDDCVSALRDQNCKDGNKKITLKEKTLKKLYRQAEKNRWKRMPFLLYGLYGIKNAVFGKKVREVERIITPKKKIKRALNSVILQRAKGHELIVDHVKSFVENNDLRFESKNKVKVEKRVVREEIAPYLEYNCKKFYNRRNQMDIKCGSKKISILKHKLAL